MCIRILPPICCNRMGISRKQRDWQTYLKSQSILPVGQRIMGEGASHLLSLASVSPCNSQMLHWLCIQMTLMKGLDGAAEVPWNSKEGTVKKRACALQRKTCCAVGILDWDVLHVRLWQQTPSINPDSFSRVYGLRMWPHSGLIRGDAWHSWCAI